MRMTMMPARLALFIMSVLLSGTLIAAAPAVDDAFRPGNAVTDGNPYPVKLSAPLRKNTTLVSGTIAQANTYQSALAADPLRNGCAIQNKSAENMRIYIGSPASASDAPSFDVEPGGTFSCASGGLVVIDQISVAARLAGAAYTVARQ